MKNCKKCGALHNDEARYCPICGEIVEDEKLAEDEKLVENQNSVEGEKLVEDQKPVEDENPVEEEAPELKKKKSHKPVVFIIIGIILLALIMFLIFRHRHKFEPATCVLPATCECGETQGVPLGHKWVEPSCINDEKCAVCGEKRKDALGHDFAEATCDIPKTCTRCGEVDGEALGHDFSKGDCVTDEICSRCGTVISAPGHKYIEATCEAAKHCEVCGEEVGNPLGHEMVKGKCSRCGLEMGSLGEISKICGLKSKVEDSISICVVNINDDHNPYDVEYDYGEAYNAYIEACDWSLVFDADYYISTFPMLAKLYHYDKALLLEHFQTVGIHEGRQGNKDFNVSAYYYNCSKDVYEAFKGNYEGYYFYYMLNYDAEKSVDTTKSSDHEIKKQMKVVMTAQQKAEFAGINKYRAEVGAEDVMFDSELAAFANYRGYINVSENWDAHDWAKEKNDILCDILDNDLKAGLVWKFGENNITSNLSSVKNYYSKDYTKSYRDSKDHYECMISTKYKYVGTSHNYIGVNNKLNTYKKNYSYQGAQFDVYLNNLSTPLHP